MKCVTVSPLYSHVMSKFTTKRDTRALIEKVESVDFEYLQTPIGDARCHFRLPLVAKSLNKPNKPLHLGS